MKISLIVVISVIAFVLAIAIGSMYVPPIVIVRIILFNTFRIGDINDIDPRFISVIWTGRLPRALVAFVVGAMLSVSGAIMQSVLRNPLASSFTLGVSAGASLGASFVIFFSITIFANFALPALGFIFSMATIAVVLALTSKISHSMENSIIVLVGMVVSLFINAIVTLLMSLNRESMQTLVFWQMGSFSTRRWDTFYILFWIALVFILVAYTRSKTMDILSFGEETAQTMGVNVSLEKWLLLGIAALLTGSAIAFTGIIGFIDLVAPHIVRRVFGSRHRLVIPLSALFGGIFMVICDLIARTILAPTELPIGVVTALIGAPFFAYIYISKRKRVGL